MYFEISPSSTINQSDHARVFLKIWSVIVTVIVVNDSVCNRTPEDFTVQHSQNTHGVHDAEVTIDFDPRIRVYMYPIIDDVEFLFNEFSVSLKAFVTPGFGRNAREEIHLTGMGYVKGAGELHEIENQSYMITMPNLSLKLNTTTSTNVPVQVKDELLSLVQCCVSRYAFKYLSNIRDKNLLSVPAINGERPKTGPADSYFELNNQPFNSKSLCSYDTRIEEQGNGNILVDMILMEIARYFENENIYSIPIPNIDVSFKTGHGFFSINGNFQTANGRFEDVTSLVRLGDSLVVFQDSKFIIAGVFGLSTAKLSYDSYKFKYGYLKVGGQVRGGIDGMAVELKISIKFSDSGCYGKIDFIRVSKPGKLSVSITGLGVLNMFMSKLITSVSSIWNDKISLDVENIVIRHFKDAMAAFNCNAYKGVLDRLK